MWRPYQTKDLTQVLGLVGSCLLEANLCNWHPGDILHWMSHYHEGDNLDQMFWLYEDQDLLALAHLPATNEIALVVKTEARVMEQNLLQDCLMFLQQRARLEQVEKPAVTVSVAISDTQRLDNLQALGFIEQGPHGPVAIRSLSKAVPAATLPEGFVIRNLKGLSEAGHVAEVYNAAFSSSWSAQTYLKAMQTPGFNQDHLLVVTAPDGRFASFLMYWLDPVSQTGLFEPVGCHPDFRRLGLTRALMLEGLQQMRQAHMKSVLIGYDVNNQAAHGLYASLGFRLHCNYVMYKNLIPDD